MRKYKWRLYADEDIEKEIVNSLRLAKFDVLWVAEEPSLRKSKEDLFHFRKSKQKQRYFVTKDLGFWSDSKYLIHQSPGLIILTSQNKEMGALLVRLLRKFVDDYNLAKEPFYLDGMKIKISNSNVILKFLDNRTHRKTIMQWSWEELFKT